MNIDKSNLLKIASTGLPLSEFSVRITLGRLMDLLEEIHPGEFQDDIPVSVTIRSAPEIYHCGGLCAEGDWKCASHYRVRCIQRIKDWYGEESKVKKYGYWIDLQPED